MKYGLYIMLLEHHLRIYSSMFEVGWGNGYVLVPSNHPFYNVDYDNISVHVHGGLTFGQKFNSNRFLEWISKNEILGDVTIENYKKFEDYWMIGFDTAHYGDDIYKCSKEYVIKETNDLLEQCLDESIKGIYEYKRIYLRKDKLKRIESL